MEKAGGEEDCRAAAFSGMGCMGVKKSNADLFGAVPGFGEACGKTRGEVTAKIGCDAYTEPLPQHVHLPWPQIGQASPQVSERFADPHWQQVHT